MFILYVLFFLNIRISSFLFSGNVNFSENIQISVGVLIDLTKW